MQQNGKYYYSASDFLGNENEEVDNKIESQRGKSEQNRRNGKNDDDDNNNENNVGKEINSATVDSNCTIPNPQHQQQQHLAKNATASQNLQNFRELDDVHDDYDDDAPSLKINGQNENFAHNADEKRNNRNNIDKSHRRDPATKIDEKIAKLRLELQVLEQTNGNSKHPTTDNTTAATVAAGVKKNTFSVTSTTAMPEKNNFNGNKNNNDNSASLKPSAAAATATGSSSSWHQQHHHPTHHEENANAKISISPSSSSSNMGNSNNNNNVAASSTSSSSSSTNAPASTTQQQQQQPYANLHSREALREMFSYALIPDLTGNKNNNTTSAKTGRIKNQQHNSSNSGTQKSFSTNDHAPPIYFSQKTIPRQETNDSTSNSFFVVSIDSPINNEKNTITTNNNQSNETANENFTHDAGNSDDDDVIDKNLGILSIAKPAIDSNKNIFAHHPMQKTSQKSPNNTGDENVVVVSSTTGTSSSSEHNPLSTTNRENSPLSVVDRQLRSVDKAEEDQHENQFPNHNNNNVDDDDKPDAAEQSEDDDDEDDDESEGQTEMTTRQNYAFFQLPSKKKNCKKLGNGPSIASNAVAEGAAGANAITAHRKKCVVSYENNNNENNNSQLNIVTQQQQQQENHPSSSSNDQINNNPNENNNNNINNNINNINNDKDGFPKYTDEFEKFGRRGMLDGGDDDDDDQQDADTGCCCRWFKRKMKRTYEILLLDVLLEEDDFAQRLRKLAITGAAMFMPLAVPLCMYWTGLVIKSKFQSPDSPALVISLICIGVIAFFIHAPSYLYLRMTKQVPNWLWETNTLVSLIIFAVMSGASPRIPFQEFICFMIVRVIFTRPAHMKWLLAACLLLYLMASANRTFYGHSARPSQPDPRGFDNVTYSNLSYVQAMVEFIFNESIAANRTSSMVDMVNLTASLSPEKQQGVLEFTLFMINEYNDWKEQHVIKAVNQPIFAVFASPHEGSEGENCALILLGTTLLFGIVSTIRLNRVEYQRMREQEQRSSEFRQNVASTVGIWNLEQVDGVLKDYISTHGTSRIADHKMVHVFKSIVDTIRDYGRFVPRDILREIRDLGVSFGGVRDEICLMLWQQHQEQALLQNNNNNNNGRRNLFFSHNNNNHSRNGKNGNRVTEEDFRAHQCSKLFTNKNSTIWPSGAQSCLMKQMFCNNTNNNKENSKFLVPPTTEDTDQEMKENFTNNNNHLHKNNNIAAMLREMASNFQSEDIFPLELHPTPVVVMHLEILDFDLINDLALTYFATSTEQEEPSRQQSGKRKKNNNSKTGATSTSPSTATSPCNHNNNNDKLKKFSNTIQEFYEKITQLIRFHQGLVVECQGSSIVAMWNGFKLSHRAPMLAACCALHCHGVATYITRKRLESQFNNFFAPNNNHFNNNRYFFNGSLFHVGIGIHQGKIRMGNVGGSCSPSSKKDELFSGTTPTTGNNNNNNNSNSPTLLNHDQQQQIHQTFVIQGEAEIIARRLAFCCCQKQVTTSFMNPKSNTSSQQLISVIPLNGNNKSNNNNATSGAEVKNNASCKYTSSFFHDVVDYGDEMMINSQRGNLSSGGGGAAMTSSNNNNIQPSSTSAFHHKRQQKTFLAGCSIILSDAVFAQINCRDDNEERGDEQHEGRSELNEDHHDDDQENDFSRRKNQNDDDDHQDDNDTPATAKATNGENTASSKSFPSFSNNTNNSSNNGDANKKTKISVASFPYFVIRDLVPVKSKRFPELSETTAKQLIGIFQVEEDFETRMRKYKEHLKERQETLKKLQEQKLQQEQFATQMSLLFSTNNNKFNGNSNNSAAASAMIMRRQMLAMLQQQQQNKLHNSRGGDTKNSLSASQTFLNNFLGIGGTGSAINGNLLLLNRNHIDNNSNTADVNNRKSMKNVSSENNNNCKNNKVLRGSNSGGENNANILPSVIQRGSSTSNNNRKNLGFVGAMMNQNGVLPEIYDSLQTNSLVTYHDNNNINRNSNRSTSFSDSGVGVPSHKKVVGRDGAGGISPSDSLSSRLATNDNGNKNNTSPTPHRSRNYERTSAIIASIRSSNMNNNNNNNGKNKYNTPTSLFFGGHHRFSSVEQHPPSANQKHLALAAAAAAAAAATTTTTANGNKKSGKSPNATNNNNNSSRRGTPNSVRQKLLQSMVAIQNSNSNDNKNNNLIKQKLPIIASSPMNLLDLGNIIPTTTTNSTREMKSNNNNHKSSIENTPIISTGANFPTGNERGGSPGTPSGSSSSSTPDSLLSKNPTQKDTNKVLYFSFQVLRRHFLLNNDENDAENETAERLQLLQAANQSYLNFDFCDAARILDEVLTSRIERLWPPLLRNQGLDEDAVTRMRNLCIDLGHELKNANRQQRQQKKQQFNNNESNPGSRRRRRNNDDQFNNGDNGFVDEQGTWHFDKNLVENENQVKGNNDDDDDYDEEITNGDDEDGCDDHDDDNCFEDEDDDDDDNFKFWNFDYDVTVDLDNLF